MKKILLASALLLGVSFTSCNSYLDINTDPNSPAEENVETSMLMPAIEMNTASSYGNFLRIAGGFHAQQYAHLFGELAYKYGVDRKSTRLNSSHANESRMPSSA